MKTQAMPPDRQSVEGASAVEAMNNMRHFVDDCQLAQWACARDPDKDGLGFYGFRLAWRSGERSCAIKMPGCPLESVRPSAREGAGEGPVSLCIDGEWGNWNRVVGVATERLATRSSAIRIHLHLRVAVVNELALRAFLTKQRVKIGGAKPRREGDLPPATMPVDDAVADALIYANGNPPPETYGLAFDPADCRVSRAGEGHLIGVDLAVTVHDEVALWKYALARYRACWFNDMADEKEPGAMSLPTAVLEALICSNENPSPFDYGVEIDDYSARVLDGGVPLSYQEVASLL